MTKKQKTTTPQPKVERPGRVSITFTEPSLTQQQFKSAVDVNNIVRNYAQTGIDPYESRRANQRFQAGASQSFTEAMFHVAEINSRFAELPALERQTYSNDPSRWLADLEAQAIDDALIVDPDEPEAVLEDEPPSDPPADDAGSEA